MRFTLRIKDRGDWAEVRSRGHSRWVYLNGALGTGLQLLLLIATVAFVFRPSSPGAPADVASWLAIGAGILLIALYTGYYMADVVWHKWSDRG